MESSGNVIDLNYEDDLIFPSDAPPFDKDGWRKFAACKGLTSLFFPENNSSNVNDVNGAKEVCRECPVAQPCLDYALDNYEKVGVWGGTGEPERRVLRRIKKAQ